MERLRQGWATLKLKWYGPPPPPPAVIIPVSLSKLPTKARQVTAGSSARRNSSRGSRSLLQKRPTRPPLCRNVKDYAVRLERLVSGLQRLEDAERQNQAIAEQIAQQLAVEANEEEDDDDVVTSSDDSSPLDLLLDQQDAAEETIKDELNEMTVHADCVYDSIYNQGVGRAPLPMVFIAQIQRYEATRTAFVQRRVSEEEEKVEDLVVRQIDGILFRAENRTHNRGWIPTQGRLTRLRDRKAGITKRRRVLGICKKMMTSELKRLCRGEAALTLESRPFRAEYIRTKQVKRTLGS